MPPFSTFPIASLVPDHDAWSNWHQILPRNQFPSSFIFLPLILARPGKNSTRQADGPSSWAFLSRKSLCAAARRSLFAFGVLAKPLRRQSLHLRDQTRVTIPRGTSAHSLIAVLPIHITLLLFSLIQPFKITSAILQPTNYLNDRVLPYLDIPFALHLLPLFSLLLSLLGKYFIACHVLEISPVWNLACTAQLPDSIDFEHLSVLLPGPPLDQRLVPASQLTSPTFNSRSWLTRRDTLLPTVTIATRCPSLGLVRACTGQTWTRLAPLASSLARTTLVAMLSSARVGPMTLSLPSCVGKIKWYVFPVPVIALSVQLFLVISQSHRT